MFRNRNGGRGQGRGAGFGNGQGRGQGGGAGAGFGRGRGAGAGQGRGFFGTNQESNWGDGFRQNQSLSELSAGVPASEKRSWLERFKAHLTHRMSEVDEELNTL